MPAVRLRIHVGWADVYTWDLPGRLIDISHVLPGSYAVVVAVNPNGVLVELDQRNNRAFTIMEIPPA